MSSVFAIGIWNFKHEENVGNLWRTAYQLGADYIFSVGEAKHKYDNDVHKTYRQIPYFIYSEQQWVVPEDFTLVCIETGGMNLANFKHPKRAVYLLGNEITGIPEKVMQGAPVVSIPSVRHYSYNVAVAGALVMYDRLNKSMKGENH